MGEIPGELFFAVWMWILVLMLIVMGIRDYRARRNLPKNPEDKKIGRALIKDFFYFFLHPFGGGGEKHEDDNPMKYKGNGNKYI
jgi:hypothetical protein